ncbi:hypothetical protein Efla_006137 [Eimeria flavescens]
MSAPAADSAALLVFQCFPTISASVAGGPQPRRLAEGYGDEAPSSPELLDLCFEFGGWKPSEGTTDGQRDSPSMVEAFFESLNDQQKRASQGSTGADSSGTDQSSVSPPGVKRSAPDDYDDDGDEPGAGQKVARTEATEASIADASSLPATAGLTALPVFALARSSDAGSDMSGSPSSIGLGPSSSVAASSASPPTAADSQPSTSQARDGRMSQHPFLRVPFLETGVRARDFQPSAGKTIVGDRYIGLLLRHLRNLLRMPSLGHEHANAIVNFAERLASHARQSVGGPLPKVRPRLLAERIARRFLVFYVLHMASKAVQQNWPEQRWWRELAAAIPTDVPATMSEATVRPPGWPMLALARRLAAAASVYKRGGSLRDEELVALMVDLFGPQGCPGRLRDSVWGPWRLDARHESSSS